MAVTGQRTTANARASSTSSTSGSTSSPSGSSSKKSSSKKSSGREFTFGEGHPFNPGDEVQITSIDGQTTKKATVNKDGQLKVSGLKDGTYTATADAPETDEELTDQNHTAPQNLTPPDVSVTFTVKDNEAARKAKYDRYGGAQPAIR